MPAWCVKWAMSMLQQKSSRPHGGGTHCHTTCTIREASECQVKIIKFNKTIKKNPDIKCQWYWFLFCIKIPDFRIILKICIPALLKKIKGQIYMYSLLTSCQKGFLSIFVSVLLPLIWPPSCLSLSPSYDDLRVCPSPPICQTVRPSSWLSLSPSYDLPWPPVWFFITWKDINEHVLILQKLK